jgi:hypothetical protein
MVAKSLLIEAVKQVKPRDLDLYIENTKAYIQARGYQKETMYHKSLYLLVAKKMKQELKKGGLK